MNTNPKEVTLADILACLKEQKDEIQDVKRVTTEKIGHFMAVMEASVNEVKKDVNVLNTIMEERERGSTERMKNMEERCMEMEKKRRDDNEGLGKKMKELEEAIRNASMSKTKQKSLIQMQTKEGDKGEIQFLGRRHVRYSETKQGGENTEMTRENKTHGFSVENVSKGNNEVESHMEAEHMDSQNQANVSIPIPGWHKSVQEELKEAANEALRVEKRKKEEAKERRKSKGGMKSIKKWFAQESPDTSEVSADSDSSENDSEAEVVNRRERNRDRKRRNNENKKKLKEEIAKKARHTIGCQPITKADIEEMKVENMDIKEAQKLAVLNYLKKNLQFNDEEIAKVVIMDTKISQKGDNTVYASFRDIDTIKEIHWRLGEIRNPALIVRNYVPPQYWARYMYLSKECNVYRSYNKNTKTQMRFGERDVEILLKQRGTDEAYQKVPFETITDPRYIPKFEHNIKWTQGKDATPRRKLVAFNGDTNRMETDNINTKIVRQSSLDLKRQNDKRVKPNSESSSSSDSNKSDESI